MLIDEYKMSVQGDKLTMTVGGKKYTFTKATKKRDVKITFNVSADTVTETVGDSLQIKVKATPFWACDTIKVTATNGALLYPSSQTMSSIEGNFLIDFSTIRTGETQLIIKDSSGKYSKTINLKVVAPPPVSVSGIQLNKTNLELLKGNSETLVATVTPSNADNKNVTWSSSNNSVVEVSNTGKVTAKGKGSATITVKTADGGFSAQCQVTVNEPPLSVSATIGIGLFSTNTSMVQGVYAEVEATQRHGAEDGADSKRQWTFWFGCGSEVGTLLVFAA
jgi:uncharacterized protein YjdB